MMPRVALAAAATPAALLVVLACSGEAVPPPRLSGPSDASYVGARACATCHAAIASTFARTGMGRSLYPVGGDDATPYARLGETVEIPEQGLHYTVYQENGRWFQKQFQVDEEGREINSDVREVAYAIGSGNHSRSFVTIHEGRHYQMPLCWYPQADRWDLCPGFETRNHYFQRGIDDTCLFCHNGRVIPAGTFTNMFDDPFPHGIGCERCHGPGSRHVARWSSPSGPDLDPGSEGRSADPTIANPARMDPSRSIQVCMQCHLGDSTATERVSLRRTDPLDYRPGLDLSEFVPVFTYREPLPGAFGLTGQADRLALSRCFTGSGGRLQCTTCHDPHVEVYEVSSSDPGHFNRICAGCHESPDCEVPGGSPAEDCVSCHMRRAEPSDQRYTTFLDHWIRRDPGQGLDRARTDETMEPFFGESVAGPDPARGALLLGRAYYNKITAASRHAAPWNLALEALSVAARRDPGEAAASFYQGKVALARGRLREAERWFREALAIDATFVDALQELGSVFLLLGRLDEARATLLKALEAGPRSDDVGAVLNEIARVELQSGRLGAARTRLEAAERIEPFSPEIHANLGLLSYLENDMAAAIQRFGRALTFSPNEPFLYRHLSLALSAEGPHRDLARALSTARTAARLDPADADSWLALVSACRASGHVDQALEAAQRALALRPRSTEVLLAAGISAIEAGKASAALEPLAILLEIDPDLAAAHTALGQAYRQRGQEALAREHLSRAAALGDEEARRLLR